MKLEKLEPSRSITDITLNVRGKDDVPYVIHIYKRQPDHKIYITIKAELFVDADFEHVGPDKHIIVESLMKSDIEEWRQREEEYQQSKKEKTFVIEPWLKVDPPKPKKEIPEGFKLPKKTKKKSKKGKKKK